MSNVTTPWQNPDGLPVKFAGYYQDSKNFINRSMELNTLGAFKEIEIDVDLTKIPTGTVAYTSDANNDGTRDSFNIGDPYIPAYAVVTGVRFVGTENAAGGTSMVVGTYRKDGTVVTANNLLTATEGVTANILKGTMIVGAGTLNTDTSNVRTGVGANSVYVGVKTSGTFTAGKGRLIISYIEANADLAANQ